MTNDEINTLREKAELYDMWDCVHNLEAVYDFDSVMDAKHLKDRLERNAKVYAEYYKDKDERKSGFYDGQRVLINDIRYQLRK